MTNDRNFSVMLVDDDKASILLTTYQLKRSNLFSLVLAFNNAESALKHIEENSFATHSEKCLPMPHILITDVYIPVLDGFELIEHLLKMCPGLRETTTLCILTASGSPRDKKKAKELGVDFYFEKPLNDWHFQQLREVAKNKGMPIA